MYAKIQPKNLLFHYDNGIQIKNNQMWNFYGALSTNRQIDDNQVRVGAEVFSPTGDWSCSNMIQYTQSAKGNNLQFLHKGYSLHDQKKCVFNNYTTLNITKRAVEQIALLAGYRGWGSVSNDIFVRYELDGFSNAKEFQNSLWEKNKLTVDWINGKKGSFVHGIEFSSSIKEIVDCPCNIMNNFSTAFEVDSPENNAVFKLKLASNWSAALSLKHKIGSYGSYTWGAELSDIGSKNKVKFGVQFDLNV